MSHAAFETLSALADGELTRDEIRFVLRRTERNDLLRDAWGRYHVIRAGMRHEVSVLADEDFADRVMAHIDTAPGNRRAGRSHHWIRWSAGGAIAAGVAAAALIVVQPQMRPSASPATAAGPRIATAQSAPQSVTPATAPMKAPDVPRWLSASPSAAQMAQPAAANFYMGPPVHVRTSHNYARHLDPYMTLPGYRAPTTRDARRAMHELWSMTPRRTSPQPALRAQAQ